MIQNASVLGAVAAAFLFAAIPFASGQILPGEREWDCSRDHAPHGSNSNRFLQSASGIFSGAAVVESSCATKLQVFSQLNGRCRCVFAPKLRALLEQPCHARLVPGMDPQEYEVLVPTLDRETIEELYVRKSCYSLLTDNIVDFFLDKGVNPLFFNLSRCRCDWTPESDAVSGRPAGEGEICERLVDQNFTSRQVSSDEVGNWISVFPFSKQRDMPVMNDGTVFGDGLHATVGWGLMGADFKDIHIVARFISSPASTGRQTIVTNICQNSRESRGFFELTYSPEQQQYSLRFFKQQTVTCTPDPALGGYSEQTVEVIYRRGNVRLEVNGFPCDVSTLNPVASLNNRRIQFNTLCPLQLGGAVFTDLSQPNFGNADTSSEPLRGVYKRFMAVRNCEAPPRLVLDRIQGLV